MPTSLPRQRRDAAVSVRNTRRPRLKPLQTRLAATAMYSPSLNVPRPINKCIRRPCAFEVQIRRMGRLAWRDKQTKLNAHIVGGMAKPRSRTQPREVADPACQLVPPRHAVAAKLFARPSVIATALPVPTSRLSARPAGEFDDTCVPTQSTQEGWHWPPDSTAFCTAENPFCRRPKVTCRDQTSYARLAARHRKRTRPSFNSTWPPAALTMRPAEYSPPPPSNK